MSSVRRTLYPGRLYLLRDEFNDDRAVNTINGTPAVPGPGTRLVTDTNGKIGIVAGLLNFATGAAINDGMWWSLPVFARLNGQVQGWRVFPSDTNGIINVGLDANTSGAITDCLVFAAAGALQVIANGGTAVAVGVYTATAYEVKAVMRASGIYWLIKGGAFTMWTLLRPTSLGTAAGYAAVSAGSGTSVFTADYDRGPAHIFLIPALAHDTFTRANGAIGNTEPAGPDSQGAPILAWTGATWTILTNQAINTPTLPTTGGPLNDGELLTDPGLEANYIAGLCNSLDANGAPTVAQSADVHGGAKAQQFTATAANDRLAHFITNPIVGGWYRLSVWSKRSAGGNGTTAVRFVHTAGSVDVIKLVTGANYAQFVATLRAITVSGIIVYPAYELGIAFDTIISDDDSIKIFTLSELIASLQDVATPNVVIDATLAAYTEGTQIGIVARLDSAAAPANFIIAYQDDANVKIDECVAGVYTNLATVASAFAASDVLRLDLSSANYRLYKVTSAGVATLISASTTNVLTGNLHGLFSTYSANTFSKVTVMQKAGYSIPE